MTRAFGEKSAKRVGVINTT